MSRSPSNGFDRAGSRRASRTHSASVERLEPRKMLAVTLPSGFKETVIASGLPQLTSMTFAPDGRLFYTERGGKIRIIKNGQLLSTPFLSLNVDTYNSRGILGMTFDPNYSSNGYFYITYSKAVSSNQNTANNGSVNRIARFKRNSSNPDIADSSSQKIILDNIPNELGGHQGGFLYFKDGKLFVGIGDAGIGTRGQDMSTLNGKILRLDVNKTPPIPTDNPFYGQSGKRGEIWAVGFRNPFTAGIDPTNGRFLVNDVGGSSWEEVNEIQKGKNYGWAKAEGNSTNTAYTNPLYTYSHNGTDSAGVGGTFYYKSQFPSQYSGKYFFADFVDGWVKTLNPSTRAVSSFATGLDGPVDLDVAPDGSLYYIAFGGQGVSGNFRSIRKISYVGAGTNRAPDAVATATPTSGTAPLTVKFDASGSSDPDGDSLSYSWVFGDGGTSTSVSPSHTFNSNGIYTAKVTVKDSKGLSTTANAPTVSVGNTAPVPKITAPLSTLTYTAGSTIDFSGSATDKEDGTLSSSKLNWRVDFHHDSHSHPFIDSKPGISSGSFQIPNPGDETSTNVFYRIYLEATDSKGVVGTTFVDIKPKVVSITVNTSVEGPDSAPSGLGVLLDGSPKNNPTTFSSVVNQIRNLEAPATQSVNGKAYEFVSWSDGGARVHDINAPTASKTYTATYRITGTATPADTTQKLTSFTLWNADTDQPILFNGSSSIPEGATIDYSAIGTRNINITANTSPYPVGSVKFGFDGNTSYKIETTSPYALGGNDGADYFAWTPSAGSHTLVGTPYSAAAASGTAGTPLTLNFTIVDSGARPAALPQVYQGFVGPLPSLALAKELFS